MINLDLHYSMLLAQEMERFACEPITSCYLTPGNDGFSLIREPIMDVLQRMYVSPDPVSATCSLRTQSNRLLGFAYYPGNREAAVRIASRLEPSFIVEADGTLLEMTYLVAGTNEEICAIVASIDDEDDADCKTAEMFLIPFRSGKLATKSRDTLDKGHPLKVHDFEAIMSRISAFQA